MAAYILDITEDLKSAKEGKLQSLLYKLRLQLRELMVKLASGKLEDTSLIKKTKKNIARVLTKINALKKQHA